jgi:hypothetical protein
MEHLHFSSQISAVPVFSSLLFLFFILACGIENFTHQKSKHFKFKAQPKTNQEEPTVKNELVKPKQ